MDREHLDPGAGWPPGTSESSASPPENVSGSWAPVLDPSGEDVHVDAVSSSDAAAARMIELEHERRRIEAELAVLVDSVHRSGVYGDDGHRSVNGWVRTHSRCSDAEVTDRRRVGRLAHADDRFADAIECGRIGVAQARRLARAFGNPRCGPELIEGELLDTLLDHAANLPYEDFCRVMDRWERLADADGTEQSAQAAHDGRNAHVSVVGDEVVVDAHGGTAQGAVIAEVFAKYVDAEFEADWAANRAAHGDDATAATMSRTDAQRRFDALYRIVLDAAAARNEGGPPEPLVNLVIDVHTLDQLLHETPVLEPPVDPRVRRCESATGVPVPPADMLAALWWGRVRRVVVDGAGVVVDLGRSRRLFTGSARDAALLASTHCVVAGCNVPVTSCEVDHLHEWQHGGATDQHNSGVGCRHHNRFKSRHGYRVVRDEHGYWHTFRPDGTELTDRPPDPPPH